MIDLLVFALNLLRPGGYGLIFGHFYLLLPGSRPLRRRRHCSSSYSLQSGSCSSAGRPRLRIAKLAIVRTGQFAVLCLGLGLSWEWRLLRQGGLSWTYLRGLRSLRALATPIFAPVLAIATAAGLAGHRDHHHADQPADELDPASWRDPIEPSSVNAFRSVAPARWYEEVICHALPDVRCVAIALTASADGYRTAPTFLAMDMPGEDGPYGLSLTGQIRMWPPTGTGDR